MADRYKPREFESKWQKRWEEDELYTAKDGADAPKWYALTMFPYPSGDLHTGHWYAMVPSDAAARYRRMLGHNVMFPMGFDSFGLPAENAAISHGVNPREWTYSNIERMRGQLRMMGASFDWKREIVTSDPGYYRWSQWWFLQLLKRGLAYRAAAQANWCPSCQTVLANEQVVDGTCERCDTVVSRRFLTQWFFKITDYAEELLRFEGLKWPEAIKARQRNWIGRSEGANLDFAVDVAGIDERLRVFTTRPDTTYGATFMVLAPEHALVERITTPEQRSEVESYVAETARATEIERQSTERDKTGAFTGAYAINPFNQERIPIWIADYVLVTYGSGAIMAVPAHDERDFDFAKKYGLQIIPVFSSDDVDVSRPLEEAFIDGISMINSGPFDGTPISDAIVEMTAHAENGGFGQSAITYRLRDWLISRQRYWGAPIPVVHCESCGIVPVAEEDLPVELPEEVEFTADGLSPLAKLDEWAKVSCPSCGADARRETDTMDTFICSSWYQMRYAAPHSSEGPAGTEAGKYWLPVDQYTGGGEHAVMHLLFTRFFWKAARDMGVVEGDEPMTRLFNQGVILGPDGSRMSKSRGNVVAPDEQVSRHGVDGFRCQLMFVGPWEQGGPYNPTGMAGIVRWLSRLWSLAVEPPELIDSPESADALSVRRLTHKTMKSVTTDIGSFRFNTMISRLMELTNGLQKAREAGQVDRAVWDEAIDSALLMIAPIAPHMAEELWERRGNPYSIHTQPWPQFVDQLAKDEGVEIVVQVNGKVRDRLSLAADVAEEDVKAAAMALERVQRALDGANPKRIVYVPGRLVNVVK